MHFDLDEPVTLAGFAPPPLHVETETPGLVATRSSLGGLCEKLSDRREETRIGRWVRARRPADGALIDIDDLVEMLETLDRIVLRGRKSGCTVQGRGGQWKQGPVYQRRLARP